MENNVSPCIGDVRKCKKETLVVAMGQISRRSRHPNGCKSRLADEIFIPGQNPRTSLHLDSRTLPLVERVRPDHTDSRLKN